MSEEINRRPLKTRGKKWVGILTKTLLKTNIKPDQVSMIGIVFAVLAGLSLYFSKDTSSSYYLLFAAGFIQLRLLCNMMDGMIAVEGNIKSKFGEIFNELPDRYEDVFILVCAGFAASNIALGWAAATFAVLTAYIRAFGASLGTKQYFCGPMAKPHRMFTLTVVCLIEGFLNMQGRALEYGLLIIVMGCLITVFRRRALIVKEITKR
ncbi:MAG: CDP-alcohol phosphatidyltransferase family protein [Candidatus Omnitrophica bacterium]|nr:CDP-alcohol phosphatidyltransferase family protein [Candidatus Omnitrophota bacterium]